MLARGGVAGSLVSAMIPKPAHGLLAHPSVMAHVALVERPS